MRIELPYWPPVSWLTLTREHPVVTLEACENFQKGSYRNRTHIGGANAVHRLSIPLVQGKHQQTPIRAVRIDYSQPWQRQHWRSIQAAYGNAPFWPFFSDEIQVFYEQEWLFLFDFNFAILQWLQRCLRHPTTFALSESYDLKAGEADYRRVILPDKVHDIALRPYPQVFTERHGFRADLGALDVVFCCGRQFFQG
jgi:WbqC-like protein family